MLALDKIPDVIGFLVLTQDGAVLSSGGELENDEHRANIINGLINITDKLVVIDYLDKLSDKAIKWNSQYNKALIKRQKSFYSVDDHVNMILEMNHVMETTQSFNKIFCFSKRKRNPQQSSYENIDSGPITGN